jgi:hypothetical protein
MVSAGCHHQQRAGVQHACNTKAWHVQHACGVVFGAGGILRAATCKPEP